MLSGHLYIILGEMSAQGLGPILKSSYFVFVVVSSLEFFTYSDYWPLNRYSDLDIFSHFIDCFFTLFVPFDVQKLFSLI